MIVDNEEAILNIYDTAGQEDFLAVRDQYIRIGEGFVCMYSVTLESSFHEIKILREKIFTLTENEKLPCILVGNKCDLADDREVESAAGERVAQEYGWKFLEASAKTRVNVTQTFEQIVLSIRAYRSQHDIKPSPKAGDNSINQPMKTKSRRIHGHYCIIL